MLGSRTRDASLILRFTLESVVNHVEGPKAPLCHRTYVSFQRRIPRKGADVLLSVAVVYWICCSDVRVCCSCVGVCYKWAAFASQHTRWCNDVTSMLHQCTEYVAVMQGVRCSDVRSMLQVSSFSIDVSQYALSQGCKEPSILQWCKEYIAVM